jgi:hypothetical protein
LAAESSEKRRFAMKTFVTILITGAISAGGALAGALPRHKIEAAKTVKQLPFRPYKKRPDSIGTAVAVSQVPVGVAAALPFRPYQKRPLTLPTPR